MIAAIAALGTAHPAARGLGEAAQRFGRDRLPDILQRDRGALGIHLGLIPEQLVEDVAEPCLEHVNLALGDRDALGPIVDHPPAGEVVFWRSPRLALGRLGIVVKVGRNRETTTGAAVLVEASSGHSRILSTTLAERNRDRILNEPQRTVACRSAVSDRIPLFRPFTSREIQVLCGMTAREFVRQITSSLAVSSKTVRAPPC